MVRELEDQALPASTSRSTTGVNLTPNFEAILYDRGDDDLRPRPEETIAARMTMFWRF